jgi:DNA-binding transcriptional MerR regulator
MRIGQLSEITNVSRSTIRFYEHQGLLPDAKRSENGYRLYDENDIQQLQLIKFCQTLGFSLKELPRMLPIEKSEHPIVLAKLKQKQTELNQLLEHLALKKSKMDNLVIMLETTWQRGECLSDGALASLIQDV